MTPPPSLATAKRLREEAFYRPRHVVLLADPALPMAGLLARNLAAGGFRGRLFVCGMAHEGFEQVASVADLPETPDLAVLALPPEAVEPAMAALGAQCCPAAVVPGMAPDLAGIVARTGVRALGQGSFGICVPAIGLNASLSHLAPRKGRLALICQSSALARAVLDWAEAESVGFSHVIGIGGNADLGFAHALDWLSRDPGTGAILLDIRRIKNRRMFVSAARAAARTRPVVALRAGGRLEDPVGIADAVMEAVLRRAGVLRVDGLDDLLSAAETLARVKLAPRGGAGDRIAILSNATGLARLAADAVLAGGGEAGGAVAGGAGQPRHRPAARLGGAQPHHPRPAGRHRAGRRGGDAGGPAGGRCGARAARPGRRGECRDDGRRAGRRRPGDARRAGAGRLGGAGDGRAAARRPGAGGARGLRLARGRGAGRAASVARSAQPPRRRRIAGAGDAGAVARPRRRRRAVCATPRRGAARADGG